MSISSQVQAAIAKFAAIVVPARSLKRTCALKTALSSLTAVAVLLGSFGPAAADPTLQINKQFLLPTNTMPTPHKVTPPACRMILVYHHGSKPTYQRVCG